VKTTEEDVLLSWWPIILQECQNSFKGLEPEDRLSEGAIAFLFAVRTYRIEYGSFRDYAINQLRRIMKQQNRKAWAERGPGLSVALDAPLRNYAASESLTMATCMDKMP
jgi:hypothetical protein